MPQAETTKSGSLAFQGHSRERCQRHLADEKLYLYFAFMPCMIGNGTRYPSKCHAKSPAEAGLIIAFRQTRRYTGKHCILYITMAGGPSLNRAQKKAAAGCLRGEPLLSPLQRVASVVGMGTGMSAAHWPPRPSRAETR